MLDLYYNLICFWKGYASLSGGPGSNFNEVPLWPEKMVGRSIGSGLKVKASEVMQGQRPGLTRLRARQAALHSTQGLCKGSGTWKALALERAGRGEVGNKQLLTLLTGRVVSIAKLVLGFWTFLGRVWWAGAQGSLQVGPTLASRVSVTHSANTGSVRTLTLVRNGKSNQGSRHF